MFRFVSDNVGGVGTKRKQYQRSCEACRKRHKRCHHSVLQNAGQSQRTDTGSPPAESPIDNSSGFRPNVQLPEHTSPTSILSETQRSIQLGRSEDAYLRFVGDLSPEASFLTNRNHEEGGRRASRLADVGVWLGQRSEGGHHHLRGHEQVDATPLPPTKPFRGLNALIPSLRQECLATVPPEYEFKLMMGVFYTKINPIFPILQDEVFEQHDEMEAMALQQCVCLLASLDPSLRNNLRLPHTERLLTQIEFREYLAAAVKQSLDMGFIRNKMVLLQVSVMMAFYIDKPSCSEISAYYCAQAVHHSQTLGLHLGWPDESTKRPKSRRIFWCVWTLDRLNAATNGRPVLMHSRDMDTNIQESVTEQKPTFRLFIRISEFLDQVIAQYRPHATTDGLEMSGEEQTFEDFVAKAEAADIGDALLATLELYYLAVVILRSRPKERQSLKVRQPSSSLQSYCATSIISIASEEFKSSITFLAVVPYAVSLALSVAYQTLRNSSIPYKRKQGYTAFHISCIILDELGKAFLSARTMAGLATDTLHEVERVAVGRTKSHDQARNQSMENRRTSDGIVQTPINASTNDTQQSLGCSLIDASTTGFDIVPFDLNHTIFGDYIGDAGLFNDFNPDFDLNRIDTVFSANLNPGFLLHEEDWIEGNRLT